MVEARSRVEFVLWFLAPPAGCKWDFCFVFFLTLQCTARQQINNRPTQWTGSSERCRISRQYFRAARPTKKPQDSDVCVCVNTHTSSFAQVVYTIFMSVKSKRETITNMHAHTAPHTNTHTHLVHTLQTQTQTLIRQNRFRWLFKPFLTPHLLQLTRILLRFSIYLKRKPTLKKIFKKTKQKQSNNTCPMQSEWRSCRQCGVTTEPISVLILWIFLFGTDGVPTQGGWYLSVNMSMCEYVSMWR